MQFNQGTDYAFRIIMHLATLPAGAIANSQVISKEQNIPAGFLQKIMRALTKGNLVTSYRGIEVGFALTRPPIEISLLDVINVMEGSIDLQRCLKQEEACSRKCAHQCPVHAALAVIQTDFVQALGKVNFAMLSKENNQER